MEVDLTLTEEQAERHAEVGGHAATRKAMTASSTDSLYVVISVKPVQLAIPSKAVAELMQMPKVTRLPGGPPCVRGVCNLRGTVIPMVDLRLRLGLPTYGTESEEIIQLLRQRAADHERWVDELEACTREGRKFTLTLDPEQCAFGKWYSNFRTDNVILSSALKAFDAPHRAIHQVGAHVRDLVAKGQQKEALESIEIARASVLTRLLQLFERAEQTLRDTNREIAVFLDVPGQGRLAISVDEVLSVEQIQANAESAGKPEELDQHDPLLGLTVQLQGSNRLVTMAHLEHLMMRNESDAEVAA